MQEARPLAEEVPPPDEEPEFLQPELRPAPQAAPAPQPAAPPRKAAPKEEAGELRPFPQWALVLADLEETDAMLISFLRGTHAYYDGRRVLFECSDAFRDYIRNNEDIRKKMKEAIYRTTRIRCGIGPYEPQKAEARGTEQPTIDQTLQNMQALGVDVAIEDQ